MEKGKKGLSAGRVQSVAVRMIIDREREIQAFVPEEYWTIKADFLKGKEQFEGSFFSLDGKRTELHSEEDVKKIVAAIKGNEFAISNVTKKKENEIQLHRLQLLPFNRKLLGN